MTARTIELELAAIRLALVKVELAILEARLRDNVPAHRIASAPTS